LKFNRVNVTRNEQIVTCDGDGKMGGSTRTRRWREKRAAEGKKSFTVLLSTEAQQIINSEKERTGDNYSDILERALKALNSPEQIKPPAHLREQVPQPTVETNPQPPVVLPNSTVSHTRILIDDLQNYEFNEDRVEFNYKKTPADYLNRNRKDNIIKRLVRIPGKKKWFR
jgi:hypothetical protein